MNFPPHYFRRLALKCLIFTAFVLAIPTVITWLFHGKQKSNVYNTAQSGRFVIVENNGIKESMDVEAFLPCAVMGQLSIDNNESLLKSFAVIIRTYIWKTMGDQNSIEAEKLDIPYITYSGLEELWEDSFTENYNKLMKVVSDTSLQVIKQNGELITPYYHSISCGQTRSGAEVLGEEFSYLTSAKCPDDNLAPDYFKAYYYTNEEFAELVRSIDENISIDSASPLEATQIIKRDSSGYVLELSVGNRTIDGNTFYESMQINSPSFMIEEYNGGVRITTYGVGHGLGLSLNYAAILADGGSSYMDILHYFYNDVEI